MVIDRLEDRNLTDVLLVQIPSLESSREITSPIKYSLKPNPAGQAGQR